MQGKERNNQEIDEAFVSQAWDSMNHMLDQEMPVTVDAVLQEKKSWSRYPLMLLLLLLSFGAGAGWMYWYYHSSDADSTSPPVQEAPRAMRYESPTIDPSLIENKKETASENKTTLPSAKATIENETSLNQREEKRKTNEQILSNERESTKVIQKSTEQSVRFGWVPANTQNSKSIDLQNVKITASEKITIDTKEVEKALSTLQDSKLIRTRDRRSGAILNILLNTQNTALLAEESPELNPSFITPSNKKWQLAIETSTIRDSETKEFGGSFSFGAVVARKLDNRFALQAGMSWHHLVKRPRAAGSTSNSLNTFGLNSDTLAHFVLEDYYANAVQTGALQVLDYVKVPLQLSYKVNSFFRIHTGIHAAYLLSPFQKDPVVGGENEPPTAEVLANTRSKFVRAGLRKMDFGIQVGMGFYPTKRIGIFVNYNSGLLDFSDNEHFQFKEVHSNQYVQLGLIYYPFKR